MSYTLRGRVESRLAAVMSRSSSPASRLVLRAWWPVELVGAMLGAARSLLDVLVYHRFLPYQPGWAALPLGMLELGATMGLVFLLDIDAPLRPAIWFFVGSWILAQVLARGASARAAHVRRGRRRAGAGGQGPFRPRAVLPARPPRHRGGHPAPDGLSRGGSHAGPLVLDHSQTLVGRPGAVVRGGIVITSDDVVVRDLAIEGGEYGIAIEGAKNVLLDRVSISGATMDGINARRSSLTVQDCSVRMTGEYTQGIDIGFAFDLPPSRVSTAW